MARRRLAWFSIPALALLLGGCTQWFLNEADQEVYDLIRSRQLAALGEEHPVDIGREDGHVLRTDSMYDFAPHPVDTEVPEMFVEATRPPFEGEGPPYAEESMEVEAPGAGPLAFTLADCLGYAQQHSREYQTAKEDLYLSALALSLERFLWTPQPSGDLSFEFADYGQVRQFDRAMTAIASVAVEQRLPLGGTVSARLIDTWMRDLRWHTTTGETGQVILAADIPLLRGAGRVAYESRYQAERDLIYDVRAFERFRREFLVSVAADFYRLLSLQAQVENAEAQVTSLRVEVEKATAEADEDRILRFEADRTRVELLQARNRVASARETLATALDQFKIRLNMPTETPLVLLPEDPPLEAPDVAETKALRTAMRYRLDLLNQLDAIDDARRGVQIAKNNMLPDFDFTGSITLDTDPNKPDTLEYNTERTTWRGRVDLELPLTRKEERNTLRSAFIDLRRAERDYDLAKDRVVAEVRADLRQIALAQISLDIQAQNIAVNEFRRAQVIELRRLGQLSSTRDVIEAENDLRNARNAYANALANYKVAVLEFLLASGALRVDDDGSWTGVDGGRMPPVPSQVSDDVATVPAD